MNLNKRIIKVGVAVRRRGPSADDDDDDELERCAALRIRSPQHATATTSQSSTMQHMTTDELCCQMRALEYELVRRQEKTSGEEKQLCPEDHSRRQSTNPTRSHTTCSPSQLCPHVGEEHFFRSLDMLNTMAVTGGLTSSSRCYVRDGPQEFAQAIAASAAEERQLVVVRQGNSAKLVRLMPVELRLSIVRVDDDAVSRIEVVKAEVTDYNGEPLHKNYEEFFCQHQTAALSSCGGVKLTRSFKTKLEVPSVSLALMDPLMCRQIVDDICHGYLPDFLMSVYPHGVQLRGEWNIISPPNDICDGKVMTLSSGSGGHFRQLTKLRDLTHSQRPNEQDPNHQLRGPSHDQVPKDGRGNASQPWKQQPRSFISFGPTEGSGETFALRVLTPIGEARGHFPVASTTVMDVKRELLKALECLQVISSTLLRLGAVDGKGTVTTSSFDLCLPQARGDEEMVSALHDKDSLSRPAVLRMKSASREAL